MAKARINLTDHEKIMLEAVPDDMVAFPAEDDLREICESLVKHKLIRKTKPQMFLNDKTRKIAVRVGFIRNAAGRKWLENAK